MEWLRQWALTCPRKRFLNEYDYEAVYRETVGVAAKLAARRFDEGRIALYGENSPAMAVILFAALLLKQEVLTVNIHLSESETVAQLTELGIRTVVTADDMAPAKRSALLEAGIGVECLHPFASSEAVPVDEAWGRTLSWQPADNTVAVIMNTSATTGHFKSVPIRWGQIRAHVAASAKVIGVRPDDDWLVVLPMFHVSGLSIIFRTLYNGTAATIMRKYEDEAVRDCIAGGRVTMVSLVPTILRRLVDTIQGHRLRMILLGGEFIPQTLIRRCLEKGWPVYKTYGMTESFAQSATFNILEHPEKAAAVGKPLPGVTVSIKNPDKDGVGEIWLQSPMLMKGYLGKEPLGADGLNTEDIGFLDSDGFLYLLNRRKDIIISGGENIYPKELEDALYELDGVEECAIIPVADERWGQVPALFYAGAAAEDVVRDFLAQRFARYKQPKYIRKERALPKNASGKVVRGELQL